MIETNHVITPINAPFIREMYQEYLCPVAQTVDKNSSIRYDIGLINKPINIFIGSIKWCSVAQIIP